MTGFSVNISDYSSRIGEEVGVSGWIEVDQQMIDDFARTTFDNQFIHVDPERAANSPFGGTIAHGFLTLSLLSRMAFDALPAFDNSTMGVNYGFNSLRFLAPVRSGVRVRGRFTLHEVSRRDPDRAIVSYGVTVEIDGAPKPALVANWLTMAVF